MNVKGYWETPKVKTPQQHRRDPCLSYTEKLFGPLWCSYILAFLILPKCETASCPQPHCNVSLVWSSISPLLLQLAFERTANYWCFMRIIIVIMVIISIVIVIMIMIILASSHDRWGLRLSYGACLGHRVQSKTMTSIDAGLSMMNDGMMMEGGDKRWQQYLVNCSVVCY